MIWKSTNIYEKLRHKIALESFFQPNMCEIPYFWSKNWINLLSLRSLIDVGKFSIFKWLQYNSIERGAKCFKNSPQKIKESIFGIRMTHKSNILENFSEMFLIEIHWECSNTCIKTNISILNFLVSKVFPGDQWIRIWFPGNQKS